MDSTLSNGPADIRSNDILLLDNLLVTLTYAKLRVSVVWVWGGIYGVARPVWMLGRCVDVWGGMYGGARPVWMPFDQKFLNISETVKDIYF